jgi:biotin carboxylase
MTVFILGAGVMQIPAIRAAKELGWTVVVADANPDALGTDLADRFLPVDLKDVEGLAAAARGIQAEFGLDGVFTAGTDFSASAAYVAGQLGLPGIPYEAAIAASDKLKMRSVLAAAGVASPRFIEATSSSGLAAAAALSFPLVVKPADSMGARGCRSVLNGPELEAAVAAALPFSRTGRVIVEEYVEGPEFSIDALVEGDEILIRGIADRHIFFDPYFVELGHTMPSAADPEIQEEVLRVFRLAVRALGITLGVAKGDMKYCPARREAVVGEIAARLSGGYMSGWTYPYASGIDVTREALLLSVGLPLSAARQRKGGRVSDVAVRGFATDMGWISAERAFISIPGTVAAVEGSIEAERMPYVKQLFLRVGPGDRVVFPSNNVQKCGNVISQAPTREAAVEAADSAARALIIRLAPDDPETEAFLRGEWGIESKADASWPPSAFKVEGEAALDLAAMPEYRSEAELDPGIPLFAPFARASEVEGADWGGRLFAESAELACERAQKAAGARRSAQAETVGRSSGRGRKAEARLPRLMPAGRFWRALARGGIQAALYVLDTEAARGGSESRGVTSGTAAHVDVLAEAVGSKGQRR